MQWGENNFERNKKREDYYNEVKLPLLDFYCNLKTMIPT
jgi:hypothetical protein